MEYNFLSLVNDVGLRLNETQLASSNFATSRGVYSSMKEAVNSAIRHINQDQFFWPFNHNTEDLRTVPGVSRYPLPENAKYVDFQSFRLRRDAALNLNEGKKLKQLAYNEYLEKYIDQEYETDASRGGVPRHIVRTPDQQIAIVPMPNEAYRIDYEFYMTPVDLVNYDDVPSIPPQFRHVIVDGAMYYAYMFRDNLEMASMSQNKFEDGIKQMRVLLVNENIYVRSTVYA